MLSNVGRLHVLKNSFETSSSLFVNVFVHLTSNILSTDWVAIMKSID